MGQGFSLGQGGDPRKLGAYIDFREHYETCHLNDMAMQVRLFDDVN